jgi:hypothetical protein
VTTADSSKDIAANIIVFHQGIALGRLVMGSDDGSGEEGGAIGVLPRAIRRLWSVNGPPGSPPPSRHAHEAVNYFKHAGYA